MDRLAKGTLKLIGARYDFVCGTFQTWNAWQLKSSENCGKMCLYIQCSVRIQWCACFKLNSNKYNGGTCTKYSAVCIRYLRSAPITWDMSHIMWIILAAVDITIRAGDGNLAYGRYEKGKDERFRVEFRNSERVWFLGWSISERLGIEINFCAGPFWSSFYMYMNPQFSASVVG